MRPRSLSIRTYLLLSYLALILLLTVGMWAIANHFMYKLTERNLTLAAASMQEITAADVQLSKNILTGVGEYIIQDKAEDVARELAHHFKGKKGLLLAMMKAILAHWSELPLDTVIAPLRRGLATRKGQVRALQAIVHRHCEPLTLANRPWWHNSVLFQVLQQPSPMRNLLIKVVILPTEQILAEVLEHVRPGIARTDILLHMFCMVAPLALHANHRDMLLEQLGMKRYTPTYLAKLESMLTTSLLLRLGLPVPRHRVSAH